MNKRIETVLNNREAKPADYFELVNIFNLSSLSLQKDKHSIVSMDINEFIEMHNRFEFRQKCTDTYFSIKKEDIQSVSGRMLDDTDTFLVTVNLTDGTSIYISIFHTDTNEKPEECERFTEMDIYDLQEYFNDKEHKPSFLSITDAFGLKTYSEHINKLSVVENEDGVKVKIEYSSCAETSFSLVDDCRNEIYLKESGFADTILIKPYGQPFTEIVIVVLSR